MNSPNSQASEKRQRRTAEHRADKPVANAGPQSPGPRASRAQGTDIPTA